jgi:hypothetical protein
VSIASAPGATQSKEEAFGWAKRVAGLRKMRHRGLPKVDWQFTLAMAAYYLVRLPKLLAQPMP